MSLGSTNDISLRIFLWLFLASTLANIDLLDHIGISQDDLEQRGRLNPIDLDLQRRSKRFSFRRNVIPTSPVTTVAPTLSTTTSLSETATMPTITVTETVVDETVQEHMETTTTDGQQNGESFQTASSNSRLLQGDDQEEDGLGAATTTLPIGQTPFRLFSSNTKNDKNDDESGISRNRYELVAAFRMMAATKSPDKESGTTGGIGTDMGSVFLREDAQVTAMAAAQAIEKRVVELIATIGRLVLLASPPVGGVSRDSGSTSRSNNTVRSDAMFEYFCEKSILSLLVDIAKEKRQGSEEGRRWGAETACFHGVVWSPKVKAQIFTTMAALISESRSPSVVYYLFSNNYVNDLVDSMVPLQQWTDQALSIMMPPYADMLKKVAVQLAADPYLFPFLTRQELSIREDEEDLDSDHVAEERCLFPLYSAALETATSQFAESDSLVYGTCLVVTINIMQIEYEPIQEWVCNAGPQQRLLADHLCQGLLDRYARVANLTTGPVVDSLRSHAVTNQFLGLKDHLAMIHEVFWSGVRGLDVRLCESLLQRVVTVLLKNLLPHRNRPFLVGVGLYDLDVIPEQEALAQVSTIFLAFLFANLAYIPFQRMLAVALFHEKSTPLFLSHRWMQEMDSMSPENYIFMPLLSDIVTGENDRKTCPNTFWLEIIKGLSGQYGEWRATTCACLFQAALKSDAMDHDSLKLLEIVPSCIVENYEARPLEEAIATYLTRKHKPTALVMETLEYVGFLAIQLIQKTIVVHCMDIEKSVKNDAERAQAISEKIELILATSPVWKALLQARSYFATEAQKCQQITGVSEIFLGMIESTIQSRYTVRYDESGWASHRCPLSQRGCAASTGMKPEFLVRRIRSVSSNDVESVRFFIGGTLHLRALCKTVDRCCLTMKNRSKTKTKKSSSSSSNSSSLGQPPGLELVEIADELICTIGGLISRRQINTDLDLTGRMTFPFQPAISKEDLEHPSSRLVHHVRSQTNSNNIREHLLLVLDPTNMFVVRRQRRPGVDENRGTVVFSISLRNVIAAADDEEWLHVAIRNSDGEDDKNGYGDEREYGYLMKNGNMPMQLETNGSCLIVKQYLDRSRESLRQELLEKVEVFLRQAGSVSSNELAEEKKTLD